MGNQQGSPNNGRRRRRSTALAAGFVTGSSGKVEEKYAITVSNRRVFRIDAVHPYAVWQFWSLSAPLSLALSLAYAP